MNLPSEIFKDFELPISYYTSNEKEPPFLVYTGRGSDNMSADNKVYYKDYNYNIEYYFREKDEEMEEKIESRLDDREIPRYKSYDNPVEGEDMYVIYYTI